MVVTRATLILATIVACVVFATSTPYFLSANNLVNLLNDLALAGIVAIPATFLMMTGHVDLSVGATAAFTGVLLAASAPSYGIARRAGGRVSVAGLLVGWSTARWSPSAGSTTWRRRLPPWRWPAAWRT